MMGLFAFEGCNDINVQGHWGATILPEMNRQLPPPVLSPV
jgi:hypothetical protein